MTRLLHGESALAEAERAAQALFSGDIASLDARTLADVLSGAPSSDHQRDELTRDGPDGKPGLAIVDLLPMTTLCKSKREAREHLQAGAVSLNGVAVGPEDRLTPERLLHGSVAALRRGKKNWHVTRWQ
jgi:tyrosyl-tRNA synthetase